jgi:fatty-acyl-CoA synthase
MAEPAQIGASPSALMAQAAPPWPPIALRGVLEAAVVAQPDPTSGEIAVALAAESPLGREEIGASVKPRLGIKTPRRIEIMPAPAKTANGKVDQKLLRERLTTDGDR